MSNLSSPKPQTDANKGASWFTRIPAGVLVFALVTITLALYGRLAGFDFVKYDDDDYFAANERVQTGLSGSNIAWAFQTRHAGNWHPLTWLSLMLDAELFGPGPAGPHLTNVLLHAINVGMLFGLLWRLTGARWRSALVAALFAWHPLHVESVAWISERKDVLSTAFGLLTLGAFVEYTRQSKIRGSKPKVWYGLALLGFVLGLMSKPMLVTLPFVMLLLDWWPLGRASGAGGQVSGERTPAFSGSTTFRLMVEKLPFFALSLAACVVTYWVQDRGGAVHSLESIPLAPRIENAAVSYVRYLGKMIWPAGLAIYYPHPGHWPVAKVLGSVALVLIGSGLALRFARRWPWVLTGWCWYLGMLVPVIGLVQVGTQSMADRYTYLPLVGIFIAVVWTVNDLMGRRRVLLGCAVVAAVLGLGACAMLTFRQVAVWRDSETLFRHAATVTRNNDMAHYNLGSHYFSQQRFADAIDEYRAALQINPRHSDALVNLGVVLVTHGDSAAGIAALREARRLRPNLPDVHYNLGNALVQQREWEEARQCYEETVRLQPEHPGAHNNLGNLLVMRGRPEAAAEHFRAVLRVQPDHAEARRQLERLGATAP